MIENFFTIAITGLLAGILFSIPVAGPISIVITSNALKGKLRFCTRTAIGAVIVEFFYVFIAVFGIASLYPYYQSAVPYILFIGSVLIFIIGLKIMRTKIKEESINEGSVVKDKIKNKGGFRTGIFLNLTNPTLFLGWLFSSFMVFSFVASLGYNTGGLEKILNENVDAVAKIAGTEFEKPQPFPENKAEADKPNTDAERSAPTILLSLVYALMVSLGSLAWLYIYARLIVKHRTKVNLKLLNTLIQALGVILCMLAIYMGYKGGRLL